MRRDVIVSCNGGRLPFSYLGAARGWTAPRSGARFMFYRGRLDCVVLRIAMDRVFTIFGLVGELPLPFALDGLKDCRIDLF